MRKHQIKIGIVGAGKTGKYLIEQLDKMAFIKIVLIADIDPAAPGVIYAKLRDIPVTTDFMDIARLGKKVDIIIDVTSKPEVRIGLRGHMLETENRHTIIVTELVAILLMSMAKGELAESFHGYHGYA